MGLFSRRTSPSPQEVPNPTPSRTPISAAPTTANPNPFPLDADGDSRVLESFPGPDTIQDHFVSLIKAAGLTFTIAGRCTPQEIHDEFLRLMPVCRESACHDLGVGMIFGNAYLTWCVLTDGEVSMALYPGVPDHPTDNPRAKEIFDLAFDAFHDCGPTFYHTVFMNGEGEPGEISWVEKASFVPLQWLDPWNLESKDFDPASASDQHRAIMGGIVSRVMPIYESDDSEELKQWIPKITEQCREVTNEDPRLILFVQHLHNTATRASLADWAASQNGTPLSDQGWSQLMTALEGAYPGINLVKEG